jgi:hypothetical protein
MLTFSLKCPLTSIKAVKLTLSVSSALMSDLARMSLRLEHTPASVGRPTHLELQVPGSACIDCVLPFLSEVMDFTVCLIETHFNQPD